MAQPIRFKAVCIKNFLSVKEAADIYGISDKELLHLAYPLGAVYEIGGKQLRLINEKVLRNFMDKKEEMQEQFESDYVPYAEAEKTMGFPPQVFRLLAYRANAVYKVESALYVNTNQINEYLVNYRKKLNH